MIEFLTQLVAMPMWAIAIVALFAVIGVFFLPIAIIAWKMRNEFTQKGVEEIDNKLEIVNTKGQETLLNLEKIKEEERKLEKDKADLEAATKDYLEAQAKLNEVIEINEKATAELEKEKKEVERANNCRRGLLAALSSQREALGQAKKEKASKPQKNGSKSATIKSTMKK